MNKVVLKVLYTNQWPLRLKQVDSPVIITHYSYARKRTIAVDGERGRCVHMAEYKGTLSSCPCYAQQIRALFAPVNTPK